MYVTKIINFRSSQTKFNDALNGQGLYATTDIIIHTHITSTSVIFNCMLPFLVCDIAMGSTL